MGATIQMTAHAKINTFLGVTGRREDGYHTLLSHMQAVTLCDTLNLMWEREEVQQPCIEILCDRAGVPCDASNLIYRAASLLLEALKQRGVQVGGRWSFSLEKRIPMAAGLAGGSADAAAAMRMVNQLLNTPLTIDRLCEIGATIGADIPFCLRCDEGAMTARGIGEQLERTVGLMPDAWLLIACHGEVVSTPWAFRRLDEKGHEDTEQLEQRYEKFLDSVRTGRLDALAATAYNCFESVVMPERPVIAQLKREMLQRGAALALMSGSGPSVVGYFADHTTAMTCAASFAEQGIEAHVCQGLEAKR